MYNNNMKVNKILTPEKLLQKYMELNPKNKITKWEILEEDNCKKLANPEQPIIKIILEDGNWLRVFVCKEFGEINWY